MDGEGGESVMPGVMDGEGGEGVMPAEHSCATPSVDMAIATTVLAAVLHFS